MKNTDDDFDIISKSLYKTIETTQKIANKYEPIIKQQERLQSITSLTTTGVPTLTGVSTLVNSIPPVLGTVSTLGITGITEDFATRVDGVFSAYQFNSGVTFAVEAFNKQRALILGNNISTIIQNANLALTTVIQSPMIQWLQSIDLSPVLKTFESFGCDLSEEDEELKKAYLTTMYDCKWFPYAGWTADINLFFDVSDIIATSRGKSKRREKRIDKVILNYYDKNEIKNIKRSWNNSDLESHLKRILAHALEAHMQGKYVLTTACLATLWEGLIHKKLNVVGRLGSKKTKEQFAELIKENDFDVIFSEYYNDFIVSQCDTPDDVVEGVPNRNGISHSKYKKYPNRKSSLNAILLTDFLINLSPIEIN